MPTPPRTLISNERITTPARTSTARRVAEVLVAVVIALLAIAIVGPKMWDGYFDEPFDAGRWRAAARGVQSKDHHPLRQRMAADLIDSDRLVGLTREAATELLGEPSMLTARPPGEAWYALGFYRDSRRTEWLRVCFSSADVVESVSRE
jgi:hypothetical protein